MHIYLCVCVCTSARGKQNEVIDPNLTKGGSISQTDIKLATSTRPKTCL